MSCVQTHLFMLKEFRVQDDVRAKLVGTGFEHYLDICNLVAHSQVLVEALIDIYCKDSCCFEVHGGNLYFSLLDVLNIMGFPIVGKPIVGEKKKLSEMCKKHFDDDEGLQKGKGMKLRRLLDIAKSEKPLEMRTKVAVLFLVGIFLLPDTSGSSVTPIYFSFLDDIDRLKDYAWGSAAHAELHASLSSMKDPVNPKKNLTGCAFALIVFAFIHIPKLIEYVGYKLSGTPATTFPLIKGWITALDTTSRNGQPAQVSSERLKTILRDELEEGSVVWNPYHELYQLSDHLYPRQYKDQIVVGRMGIYSFHCMRRVVNATFNAPHQFDMTDVHAEELREKFRNEELVKLAPGLQGPSKRNYNQIWATDIATTAEAVIAVVQNEIVFDRLFSSLLTLMLIISVEAFIL